MFTVIEEGVSELKSGIIYFSNCNFNYAMLNNILIWIPFKFVLDLRCLNSFENCFKSAHFTRSCVSSALVALAHHIFPETLWNKTFHNTKYLIKLSFAESVLKHLRRSWPRRPCSPRCPFFGRKIRRRRRARPVTRGRLGSRGRGRTGTRSSAATSWGCSRGWLLGLLSLLGP